MDVKPKGINVKTVFEVPGNPIGYYAVGARPNRDRMTAYHSYCQKVQLYAKMSGVTLPMTASKDTPVIVATMAFFANGVHCDPANVQKGVCDALFYTSINKGGGDKYTAALALSPLYDAENPRVVVIVSDEALDFEILNLFFSAVIVESKK